MPLTWDVQQVEQNVLVGFECSKCGKDYEAEDVYELQEMVHIQDTGGYGSVWGDGTAWDVTLCQRCAHAMFADIADYPRRPRPGGEV